MGYAGVGKDEMDPSGKVELMIGGKVWQYYY